VVFQDQWLVGTILRKTLGFCSARVLVSSVGWLLYFVKSPFHLINNTNVFHNMTLTFQQHNNSLNVRKKHAIS
jgi:hypothetical protein